MVSDIKSNDHFSDQEYLELLDVVSDGIAVYEVRNDGKEFIFRDFNHSAELIDKISRVDVIGKNVTEVFPGIKKMGLLSVFERVWRTGKSEKHPIVAYEDRRISGLRENEVRKLKSGLIVAIYRDRNDKVIEKRLEESIDRFEAVAKTAGEIIWSVDTKGVFTYSSIAIRSILGLSPEEIVGKSIFDLLEPSLVGGIKKLWGSIIRKQEEFKRLLIVVLSADKEKAFLEFSAVPVFDEEGTLIGYSGVANDVTDRQAYEENLHKFQLAVENVSDHIIITDKDGVILYANKAASVTTGYDIKELIGRTPSLWGGQMSAAFYKDMWHRIKDLKETFIGEVTNKRKNGEIYIAETRISPILNEEENVRFFVSIERDITQAKEIDRAKTEFVSLASHQLRTPLSIINWYTEMLLEGSRGVLGDAQKKYVEEVHHSNHRMIELVNALLNASRIDMGTLIIIPRPINLSEIADTAIAELVPQTEKKGTVIKKDYSDLPPINADPDLTRIIFQNLISNAVKYTPDKGEVSVKIKKDKSNVYIMVSDKGYGIPAAQQSKIFTKLFRADNARSIDPDGTGLGLYIVKAIVDAAGGKISFISEEGKGTQFNVSLPLSGMRPKQGTKSLV